MQPIDAETGHVRGHLAVIQGAVDDQKLGLAAHHSHQDEVGIIAEDG